MTSKKALEELERINSKQNNGKGDVWLEMVIDGIKKDLNKLNQLEDIEKELGIDLITLFKALKNGIYVNDDASIVFYPSRELRLGYDTHYGKVDELCILKDCNYAGNTKLVSLTNYSKNWSLDKKELENEINIIKH